MYAGTKRACVRRCALSASVAREGGGRAEQKLKRKKRKK